MTDAPPQNLDELLDRLEGPVAHEGRTDVRTLVDTIGKPQFGPLLVVVGLAGVTPLSAVPSVPSLLALCTALISVQLVFGRKTFWLPRFILDRHVTRGRLRTSTRLARKPARVVDHVLKPRFEFLTSGIATRLVALVVLLIAFAVPPLELLPFAAALPSLAILAFGLGLIARDGLLVFIALCISAASLFLVGQKLLG